MTLVLMENAEQVGRRERKKQEVLRRIQEAATELFREKGFEATTVEEIAERADVAKGTFFNYFPRKDALLASLGEAMYERVQEGLGPVERWRGTALQQFQRLFMAWAQEVEENPELSKVMLIENMRNFWMQTEMDPREQQFHALTLRVLEGGIGRGELEQQFDLEVAAKLLEMTYFTTMVDWLRRGAARGLFRREVREKLEIVFRGLGATELKREGGVR